MIITSFIFPTYTLCTWPIEAHTNCVCDQFNCFVIKQITSTSWKFPQRPHTQSLYSRVLFWMRVTSLKLLHMVSLKWSYHLDLCWSPQLGIKSFHLLPRSQFYWLIYEVTSDYLTSRLFVTEHYIHHHSNQVLFSQLLPLAACSSLGRPSATLCHQFQSLVFFIPFLSDLEALKKLISLT